MDVLDRIDSLDAERAVIGALLLEPSRVREAVQNVTPSDFGNPVLRQLYILITGRQAQGEAVDPVSLLPGVAADPVLKSNLRNPAVDLHRLMEATPTAANLGFYARQVAEAGQNRRLLLGSHRLGQLAKDPTVTAAEKLNEARRIIDGIAADYAQVDYVPTLSEVLAVEDSYDWVIPGLLERMDRMVVTGAEGLGKSTFLRQFAILSAAGIHPLNFSRIDPVRVTIIDAENTERQWRRKARYIVDRAATQVGRDVGDEIRLYCTGRLDITKQQDVARVHTILDTYPADILLIGPLYKLVSRSLNDEDAAANVIASLDQIREQHNVCLLMEAHAGHAIGGDGERNLRPRGSSQLLGWPEFGFGLAWDTSMLGPNDKPSIVNVKRWRGDREEDRGIPDQLRRGGFWNWMPLDTPNHEGRY